MDDIIGMASTLGFFMLLIGGIPRWFSHMESESVKAGRRGVIDMKTGDFVKRPGDAINDDDFEEIERGRKYRARRIRRGL